MIRRLVMAAAIVITSAHAYAADDAPKTQERLPAAQLAPPKYHIELEAADIAPLSAALIELPKRLADPLIAKINAQLQAEETARQATTAPAPSPEKPKK